MMITEEATILAEIKQLITDCINLPDGLGIPILDAQKATYYLEYLNRQLAETERKNAENQ